MSYEADLARQTIETYIKEGRVIDPPDDIPERLRTPAGVFVSLKSGGALRGCIGTIEPVRLNAAEEIIANAIAAATEDPRFYPIEQGELGDIDYSVDILGRPEPIADEAELDPKKYGCIVQSGFRRGLLLPDLEGVDTPAEQIAICRQKAGISPDDKVTLCRFTVTRHK